MVKAASFGPTSDKDDDTEEACQHVGHVSNKTDCRLLSSSTGDFCAIVIRACKTTQLARMINVYSVQAQLGLIIRVRHIKVLSQCVCPPSHPT